MIDKLKNTIQELSMETLESKIKHLAPQVLLVDYKCLNGKLYCLFSLSQVKVPFNVHHVATMTK